MSLTLAQLAALKTLATLEEGQELRSRSFRPAGEARFVSIAIARALAALPVPLVELRSAVIGGVPAHFVKLTARGRQEAGKL